MAVEVGDPAPAFALEAQDGRTVALDDLFGDGPVVVYFYPKDFSPGCTREACAFRDDHDAFVDADATVVGISSDPVDVHRRFALEHNLPFVLLSDPGDAVRERYGAESLLGLLPGRTTYVVDAAGVVRHVFDSQVRPKRHVHEAVEAVRRIAGAG